MRNRILSFSLLLLLGNAIWWMSADVVWLGDDLDYKYMMKGEIWQSWGKIKSATDFFESQWIHYQHVNGRVIAHSIVQLFNALLGQKAFAICNGIVYILFAFLIGKAGGVKIMENFRGTLSAICLSVLCFITKMMPTCQIGYIWGMTANIFWLLLFFRKGQPSWLATTSIMLAGIIVGNWQESISIGVCGGLGIWWITQLLENKTNLKYNFEWRRSWMILGYVVGTAINCLAPSTIGRVNGVSMSFTDQILIASYSFPAVVVLVITIFYVGHKHVKLKLFSFKTSEGNIPSGMLLAGMLILIAFNFAIGIYSNRQLFGANLFASILTLRILPHHRFGSLLNSLAAITVIAFWTLMRQGISEVNRQYDEIVKLHSQSEDGKVCIDRQRVMTLGFPLRAKYYEDILGQFNNDLHHSLMKDFKHVRKRRTLKLIPSTIPDAEKIEQYAPGHFYVTVKEPQKGEPKRHIKIYGHYPAFNLIKIPSRPKEIEISVFSRRRKPYATAVIIPEYPFFRADSIEILPITE